MGRTGTLALSAQTAWVRHQGQGFTVDLVISSNLPTSDLGLHFSLYSRLVSRDGFDASLLGQEAGQVVLDAPPTIPLSLLQRHQGPAGSQRVTVTFPVTTDVAPAAGQAVPDPSLGLSCPIGGCDGVYPLEVQLVDTAAGTPLASFTTHLVYTAAESGTLKLAVAVVLPVGTSPAVSPTGEAAVSRQALGSLRSLVSTLGAFPGVATTLNAYPQLLLGLSRDQRPAARSTAVALQRLVAGTRHNGSLQVLGAPFVSVDPRSLADAGTGGELARQLARGRSVLAATIGEQPRPSPFLATAPLDGRALRLLESDGIRRLVVPQSNVEIAVTSTVTAPFFLDAPVHPAAVGVSTSATRDPGGSPTSGTATSGTATSGTAATSTAPEVVVADQGLAEHYLAQPGDPGLAAADVLAELAQIYFDAPNAQQARGTVLAPSSWGGRAELGPLLEGLRSSPVLRATTINQLFGSVLPAANGDPRAANLLEPTSRPPASPDPTTLASARRSLGILGSVLTSSFGKEPAMIGYLADSLLLGETSGLDRRARRAYIAAPAAAVATISRSLSLVGSRAVTFTSRSGRIPVTILSRFPHPLHVMLRLISSQVEVPPAAVPLTVTHTRPTYVEVETRTSGLFSLRVELSSPAEGYVLLDAKYLVTSTAVSAEAILISAGAALVLAAWWLRSVLRRRRQKPHAGVTPE